jgi:hypothetical protein
MDTIDSLAEAGLSCATIAHRLRLPFGEVATHLIARETPPPEPPPRKLPRGAGYDKVSTTRHMKALVNYGGTVTQYARQQDLNPDLLAQALDRHVPDLWRDFVARHGSERQHECPGCGRVFIPTTAAQVYCERKCADTHRRDRDYFGGKRAAALGMATRTCQLCERQDPPGLSVHHMRGKENDPEDDLLLALCRGCHQLVTLVGGRNFIDNPVAWEALIALAWLRRYDRDARVAVEIEAA